MRRLIFLPLLLLLVIFLLSRHLLSAQPANTFVKGVVTSSTGEKLDAAGVFLTDTKYNTISGSDGTFVLKGVSPGDYTLVCTYLGYKKFEKRISVTSGNPLLINITLEPDAHVLEEAVIIG